MENTIKDYLDKIHIGNAQSHKNLSVFPLLSDYVVPFDYLTLDEALSKNLIDVVEIDKDGSVPELKVVNKSDRMVLILDGEELVGARQNRIVNTTILIPAKSTTVIPVSCVEQGRWSYDTDKFYSLKRVMSPKMRASKSDQVRHSLNYAKNFRSDQGAIWNEISCKAMRLDAESPSMAMSKIYEKTASGIQDYVKHFELIESQIGAVFMINGRIVGMDCFGKPETFSKVFKKLVESYALDAIDADRSKKEPQSKKKDAKQFLASAAACRLESNGATGFALVNDDRILHLSVFARENGNSEVQSRAGLQRFSLRRRFRR